MKKDSKKLYDMLHSLVIDAKVSIMDILRTRPNQEVVFVHPKPAIIASYDEDSQYEYVSSIRLKYECIEVVLNDGQVIRNKDIVSSEWLYILECVEYELEEREGRL